MGSAALIPRRTSRPPTDAPSLRRKASRAPKSPKTAPDAPTDRADPFAVELHHRLRRAGEQQIADRAAERADEIERDKRAEPNCGSSHCPTCHRQSMLKDVRDHPEGAGTLR